MKRLMLFLSFAAVLILCGCNVQVPDKFPVHLLNADSERISFEEYGEGVDMFYRLDKAPVSTSFTFGKDKDISAGVVQIDRVVDMQREVLHTGFLKDLIDGTAEVSFEEIIEEEGMYLVLININEQIGYIVIKKSN